ncbi:MAG: FtsX-like permease family protein [Bacteroidaceae bacterium]
MKQILNLKSFGVFLSRNKFYTLVNVLGFSVSMAFVILIMLYAQQEYSVDKCVGDADRIYSVCMYQDEPDAGSVEGSHWRTQRALRQTFPQIEMTCALAHDVLETTVDGKTLQISMMFADSTFFRMFSFPLSQGNADHALDDIASAVVDEAFARKVWGEANPMGKRLQIDELDGLTVHVTGVYRGMPNTSLGQSDMIIRFEHMEHVNPYITAPHMGNCSGAVVFLKAKPGNDLCGMEESFDKAYRDMGFWVYTMKGSQMHTSLLRFSERYFSTAHPAQYGNMISLRGNRLLVNLLFVVGLVILLFSVFNYINLSMAQSGKRAREIAIRRLLGTQRREIVMRLILEGLLFCLVSFLFSIALAWAASSYAGSILATRIRMEGMLRPVFLAGIFGLVVLVGVVSSAMSAIVLSRVKPVDVIRGTFRLRVRMRLTRVFIVIQNMATIIMLASALSIWSQTRHLVNAPLGYDIKGLMEVPSVSDDSLKVSTFINEVRKLSCVEAVSASAGYPFQGGNNNTFALEDRSVSLQVMIGDSCFFRVLGLRIAQDNHQANPEKGVWVNRQFLAEMGMSEKDLFVNDPAYSNDPVPVNGIVEDFKIRSVISDQHPVNIFIHKVRSPWNYLVRVRGDEAEALRQVDEVFYQVFQRRISEFDQSPYVMQKMRFTFGKERRLSTILALFAMVAVLISVLGLVAMSTYFIHQHRRDVAVRKVFGSSSAQVNRRLVGTFMSYALVAFIFAAPVAYWLVGQWMTTFSYRIEWWPCVLAAGVGCLLTSFMAVCVQSHMAANANPADHIKDE